MRISTLYSFTKTNIFGGRAPKPAANAQKLEVLSSEWEGILALGQEGFLDQKWDWVLAFDDDEGDG